jgi:ribosomal protein S18 acetylase RimI-like enzyme
VEQTDGVHISRPRNDPEGLDELAPLWKELHRHHREVADYQPLVADFELSWTSRLALYRRLLADGGCYLIASTDGGDTIGYAMVTIDAGPDDTFDVTGGLAEVVTLVVSPDHRSDGVGRALLQAAEEIARARGFDTVKIAVMSGNARAQRFYEAHGYAVAEHVLYRRLEDDDSVTLPGAQ